MRSHTLLPPRGGVASTTRRARPLAPTAAAYACRRRAAPPAPSLARTALAPLPPPPPTRATTRRRARPSAARAMVNVDFSPALVLGMGLIGGGLTLYQLRRFRPGLSRDFDVIVSSVAIFSGGILVFQGWRLDPLLLFCQLLTAGMALAFAVETLRLREEVAEEEAPVTDARSRFAEPPPPPGADARSNRGIPLPDPGPAGDPYFSPSGAAWGGRTGGSPPDPYYGEAPPSSSYGAYGSSDSYYGSGPADPASFYEWPGGGSAAEGYDGAGYGDDDGLGTGYASGGEDAWRPTAGVGGGGRRRGGGGGPGPAADDVEDWD